MWWKDKTDLFASVALFGEGAVGSNAGRGGSSNGGGSGGVGAGGPGGGQVGGGPNAASGGSPGGPGTSGVGAGGPGTGAAGNTGTGGGFGPHGEHGVVASTPFGDITTTDVIDMAVPGPMGTAKAMRAAARVGGNAITGAITGLTGAQAANPVGSVGNNVSGMSPGGNPQGGGGANMPINPDGDFFQTLDQQLGKTGSRSSPTPTSNFGRNGRRPTLNAALRSRFDFQGNFGGNRFWTAAMDRGFGDEAGEFITDRGKGHLVPTAFRPSGDEDEEPSALDLVNDVAPSGFAQNRIGTSFGQDAIDDILDTQFNQAQGVLDNASARGQVTDTGFNSGMNFLQDQRGTAQSTLSDAASNIRGDLRQSLRDRASQARDNARSNGNFDADAFESQIDDITSRGRDNFAGKLRRSVSTDELFTPNDAITRAGVAQGQTNAGRGALASALQNRRRRAGEGSRERGLGTQGSF